MTWGQQLFACSPYSWTTGSCTCFSSSRVWPPLCLFVKGALWSSWGNEQIGCSFPFSLELCLSFPSSPGCGRFPSASFREASFVLPPFLQRNLHKPSRQRKLRLRTSLVLAVSLGLLPHRTPAPHCDETQRGFEGAFRHRLFCARFADPRSVRLDSSSGSGFPPRMAWFPKSRQRLGKLHRLLLFHPLRVLPGASPELLEAAERGRRLRACSRGWPPLPPDWACPRFLQCRQATRRPILPHKRCVASRRTGLLPPRLATPAASSTVKARRWQRLETSHFRFTSCTSRRYPRRPIFSWERGWAS